MGSIKYLRTVLRTVSLSLVISAIQRQLREIESRMAEQPRLTAERQPNTVVFPLMWDGIGVPVSELVQVLLAPSMAVPLWAGRAGHLRMRRPQTGTPTCATCPPNWRWGAETFDSEDHTMHPSSPDQSSLSESDSADPSSSLTDRNTQHNQAGFSPLHRGEHNCLLGFRSDARAGELYDEAMQRQLAALDLLCVLSGTSNLNELASDSLSGCIQAIRLLCGDSAGLYSAAWDRVQQNSA